MSYPLSRGRLGLPLIAVMVLATCSFADDRQSPYNLLSSDIVAAVRVSIADTIKQMRGHTAIGKSLFDREHLDKVIAELDEENPKDWKRFKRNLERSDLTIDDVIGFLDSEFGVALSIHAIEGSDEQQAVIYAWLRPTNPDLAAKLHNSLMKDLERRTKTQAKRRENEKPARTITRETVDVNGIEATYITQDTARIPDGDDDVALTSHIVVAPVEGTWLAVMTPHSDKLGIEGRREVEAHNEAIANLTKRSFGEYLAAVQSGDVQGESFMSRMAAVGGFEQAMPEGQSLFEFAVDTPALMKLASETKIPDEGKQVMDALGIDQVGPFIYRIAMRENLIRAGVLLSAPSPRSGLMALFDQPAIDPVIPEWVSADVVDYSHVSLDLGKLYNLIRTVAIQIGGDQVLNGFKAADIQTKGMLQTDVHGVLQSFGSGHRFLTFAPKYDGFQDADKPTDEEIGMMMNRLAIVWELQNEDVWKRAIQTVGMFAGQAQGQLQFTNEQGFTGWRSANPALDGGVFMGHGYLVFAVGSEVSQVVLAALKNGLEPDARFSHVVDFDHINELIDLEPGVALQVTDLGRYLGELAAYVNAMMDMAKEDLDEDSNEYRQYKLFRDLLPTKEQLTEGLGAAVGHGVVTDEGVIGRSVVEFAK